MSENKKVENRNDELEQEPVVTPEVPAKADNAGKVKKAKSDGKKAKPGFMARVSRWWREMKSELKKVMWPNRKQTLNNTWVVILCVFFVGIFIWAFDGVAKGLIDALLSLFKG